MTQSKVSLNLSAADFVLSYRFKGPSVLVQGQDQNAFAAQGGFSGDSPQHGINIPQVAYCENTIPTSEGYRSVAYKYFIEEPATVERFVRVLSIFDGNSNSALLGVTADRKLFIVSAYTGGKWIPVSLPATYVWTEYIGVSTTTIRGAVLICITGVGVFSISIADSLLTSAGLTGVDETLIMGVCSARGYLVAWDASTVYWSSTEDITDFTPSLITGAGSAKPEGVKGKIVLCKEISQGFIVYCDACIISAAYTTNLALPWIFAVLQGGAGVRNAEAVAYDINMSNHFAWTSAGFTGVELHQASILFPQITDFIASGLSDRTETYTSYPITEYQDADKEVRLAIISSRYVCVSFGQLTEALPAESPIPQLKQAFLWDTQLKRWGKLNVDHIQLFEAPFTADPPVFFSPVGPTP